MDVKVFDQDAPETTKPLRGSDYFKLSIGELKRRSDFSAHAYRIVATISMMTTEQLEQLDVVTKENA